MSSNGIVERHWLRVTCHFFYDAFLFVFLFAVATSLRLGDGWSQTWTDYLSALIPGALAFSCGAYICGLYSPRVDSGSLFRRGVLLAICFVAALCVMLALFYLNFSSRVGRGVMLIGSVLTYGVILVHHWYLASLRKDSRPRVALLVGDAEEESEARMLCNIWKDKLELVGAVSCRDNYEPGPGIRNLGGVEKIKEIASRERLERVLCTNRTFADANMFEHFWKLRYSGVTVMPMVNLCEEVLQFVPLELVSPEWLVSASASPEMSYIKKIKRGMDVASAVAGLLLSSPLLLAGMAWVRIVSPGPVFYKQKRVGKFGRIFEVIKLRSMKLDAEKDGAVWSADKDNRVIPGGAFLRKYRIDEVPQLWNVLRGEMSLVGPRPERPEFVEMLSEDIPYYPERSMIQPGLTGWAQVNYPYGKTIEDAKRKLEYDLYYMKHMGIFLDIFVLLDTVRIILTGGVGNGAVLPHPIRKFVDESVPTVRPAIVPGSQAVG